MSNISAGDVRGDLYGHLSLLYDELRDMAAQLGSKLWETTPQKTSAATGMSRRLNRGEIALYIAAFAWPDDVTAAETKSFIQRLFKKDSFGAQELIFGVPEMESKRANPSISWEMFEKIMRKLYNVRGKYTEDVFTKLFKLEHIFKLGLVHSGSVKSRENSYRHLGGLNLGVPKYFPVVFTFNWEILIKDGKGKIVRSEKPTSGMVPTDEQVGKAIEEYLHNKFYERGHMLNPA